MKISPTVFVVGLGVVFGAAVLYAMRKEAPATTPAKAADNKQQPPPLGGTTPPAGGYRYDNPLQWPNPTPEYVSRGSYGSGPSSYNPNPMFAYYPQTRT